MAEQPLEGPVQQNPLDASRVGDDAGMREVVDRLETLARANQVQSATSVVTADYIGHSRVVMLTAEKRVDTLSEDLANAEQIITDAKDALEVARQQIEDAESDIAAAKEDILAAHGLASGASQEASEAWNKALEAEQLANEALGSVGEGFYTLSVSSSEGALFKGVPISTILTAKVYKGGIELTPEQISELGTIRWYKDGSEEQYAVGRTLEIEAGEVDSRATFEARLEP